MAKWGNRHFLSRLLFNNGGPSGHPALKAVSPQAPVTNWFIGDDFHHNGAFFLMDAFSFYAGGFGYPRPVPNKVRHRLMIEDVRRNDNYEYLFAHRCIKKLYEPDRRQSAISGKICMRIPIMTPGGKPATSETL